MKVKIAGVLEPDPRALGELSSGLQRARLLARPLDGPERAAACQLVVLGPSIAPRAAAAAARRIRKVSPQALVLQAQERPAKAGYADGVLPLPISPADLRARLPELLQLRAFRRGEDGGRARPPGPGPGPGEGILDPYTAFYVFRHFRELLFVEVKRARRYGFPVALSLLAFDPLDARAQKELREQLFGGLALAVRRSLRDTDYPVQYSPDRALVLMPHTDLAGALVVSQRICERVAKSSLTYGKRVLRPTVSVGLSAASARGGELSFADLLAHAQAALERAVAAGGDRVETHDVAGGPAAAR